MPAPASTAAPAADSKTIAENIVRNASGKAAGAPPVAKGPEIPDGDEKGKPAAAADPNAGKRKFVVDGKEVWLDQKQADGYTQKGIAFEPRISELARLQQETAAFLETLKTAPEKVLFDKRIGLTPETVLDRILSSSKISDAIKETTGKWYYENVVKLQRMDPKDRELFERDARIKELEGAEESKKQQAIALENQQRVQQTMATVRGQIAEAMKEIGLPSVDTPVGVQLAKRVADVMRLSYFARKPCTPKEAATKVRAEVRGYQRSFYDALDEDKLVEELGKDNAEKVRKYFLKAVKAAEKDEKQAGAPPPRKRGERQILTPDEFHDYLAGVKANNKV